MIRRPPRSTLFSLHDALPISSSSFRNSRKREIRQSVALSRRLLNSVGLFARRSETTQLSTQAFVLANERRRRVWLPLVLIIAVLAGVTYASVEYFDAQVAPMAQIDELERENAQLKAAVDEARMREELERATQARSEERRVGKECRFRWWAYH